MVADISDPASLDSMTSRAAAVIALAGPYAKLGTPVVEACIRNGAHYVDLTGATWLLRRGIFEQHGRQSLNTWLCLAC